MKSIIKRNKVKCPTCGGKGKLMEIKNHHKFQLGGRCKSLFKCKDCKGTGYRIVVTKTCPKCKGDGIEGYKFSSFGEQGEGRNPYPIKCSGCGGTGRAIVTEWAKKITWKPLLY